MSIRLNVALGTLLAIAACTATSTTPTAPTVSPNLVISDLQTGFSALATQLPALTASDPALAKKIKPYVVQGQSLLANLSATSPSMTTDLATIDGVINSIIDAAASSGLVPPPYSLLVEALTVLAPEVEAMVNPLLTPTQIAKAGAEAPRAHPDVANLDAARGVFTALSSKGVR